jgi:recombination protein RecA
MFGKGISATGSLLDAALKYDVLQKSGSWYSYGEERIGQGRENAKEFLESNADIAESIDQKLRLVIFPPKVSEQKNEAAEKADNMQTSAGNGSAMDIETDAGSVVAESPRTAPEPARPAARKSAPSKPAKQPMQPEEDELF